MDIQSLSNIAIVVGVLLVSVTIHEMMHAYVAFKLGDDLAHAHGRLSLNPLSHIDPFLSVAMPAILLLMGATPIFAAKPVPVNTMRLRNGEIGMAMVGVAGPLTNLVLAIAVGMVLRLGILSGIGLEIASTFFVINVALFSFNMLPIPPLDGSRLLYAFAPAPIQRVMEQIESFGILLVIIILLVALPVIGPVLSTVNSFIITIILG